MRTSETFEVFQTLKVSDAQTTKGAKTLNFSGLRPCALSPIHTWRGISEAHPTEGFFSATQAMRLPTLSTPTAHPTT